MIRIPTRVRIPFSQMVFAAVLGVAGGIYIYKPYFDEMRIEKSQSLKNEDLPRKQKESE